MKKIIALLLVFIALTAFCACGTIKIPDNSSKTLTYNDSAAKNSDIIQTSGNNTSYFNSSSPSNNSNNSDASDTSDTSDTSEKGEESSKVKDENYKIDITKYLEYIEPKNAEEYAVLVNYDSRLTENYKPSDLVECKWTRKDRDKQPLRKATAMALDAFLSEAALNGIKDVSVTSAYRSYSYQKWLFNYYVENNLSKYPSREECEKYVMTFSCREGCSEHQTGLCCDMHNLPAADKSFGNTKAAKWLAENAHRFGFVLRFPADKEKITGIEYEPWHFRFVGRKAATHMYLNNLCLEEYVKELN